MKELIIYFKEAFENCLDFIGWLSDNPKFVTKKGKNEIEKYVIKEKKKFAKDEKELRREMKFKTIVRRK